jgi:hypothetical protein
MDYRQMLMMLIASQYEEHTRQATILYELMMLLLRNQPEPEPTPEPHRYGVVDLSFLND